MSPTPEDPNLTEWVEREFRGAIKAIMRAKDVLVRRTGASDELATEFRSIVHKELTDLRASVTVIVSTLDRNSDTAINDVFLDAMARLERVEQKVDTLVDQHEAHEPASTGT